LAREHRPLYSLEAELKPIPLASARKLGLTDQWVQRLEQHSPERRQVLSVERLVGGAPASRLLQPGDLILQIDGTLVNRFREVERAVQKRGQSPVSIPPLLPESKPQPSAARPGAPLGQVVGASAANPATAGPQPEQDAQASLAAEEASIHVTVLRNGQELNLYVPMVALGGRDLDRILVWAGAVLQKPHRALAAQRGIAPDGVFVSYFSFGSPATRYKLWAGRRIVEVDGRPIADLDAFIAALAGKEDRASLRLRTVAWNGSVDVITLKLDQRYWPTYELRRTAQGWIRTSLD
jgi:S1-C subfamily serine protease